MTLRPPGGGAGLAFQAEPAHVRPTWPAGPGDQRMQMHLDIEADDLEAAGARAIAAGAVLADFQPQEGVRVYLDPAGQLPPPPLDVGLHLLELVLDRDHVGDRLRPVEQPQVDPPGPARRPPAPGR